MSQPGHPDSDPPRRLPIGLAASSGLLFGGALAPDAPAALAWMALVPLFIACRFARPAVAAAYGVLFAVAASALLAAWFPATLQRFFGLSIAASWLGWLALALLVNAPAYALLCAWLAWRRPTGALAPLVIGAAWLVAEWVRAYGPVPNPYALLGTSQLDTAFAQSADLLGVFGVGAVVAAGNAALAATLARHPAPRRLGRDLAATAALVLAVYAYGSWSGSRSARAERPVRVAVVQLASASDPARAPDVESLLALTEDVRALRPALVFWPESALAFYLREPGPDRQRVLAVTANSEPELVVGGPHYRYAEPTPEYFASVFLVRAGRVAGRYDKGRLVPFAEYAPLGGWLGAPGPLRPGDRVQPLRARDVSIGAFLCGEVLFPEVPRALARAGATVLSNPSKDDWLGAEAPARQQLRAARLRAIENRRPLLRATSGGYSAVIDARGAVLASGQRGERDVLVASVAPSSAPTPYQRLGFAVAPGAAAVVVAGSRPRRRRRLHQGDLP